MLSGPNLLSPSMSSLCYDVLIYTHFLKAAHMRSEYKMHTEDLEEPSVDDLPQMLSSETVDCLLWCCMENERLFLCSMTRSACYLAARMTTAYICKHMHV